MHQIETYVGCIHTELDVIMLIDLCQQNILARVTRRLTDFERKKIQNGSVFVYEETESNIKRWTDGQIWSPSRCSGIFLTYTEHLPRMAIKSVFMKKTLTAKLKNKNKNYHIVAYVNLEDEMNGFCCLKYGNRLKMIYEEYIGANRRNMIESIYNKKKLMDEKKQRIISLHQNMRKESKEKMYEESYNENRHENIMKEDSSLSNNVASVYDINKVSMFSKGYKENEENVQSYDYGKQALEYENMYGNDWFNQNYIEDEYFYLENTYNDEKPDYNFYNKDEKKDTK